MTNYQVRAVTCHAKIIKNGHVLLKENYNNVSTKEKISILITNYNEAKAQVIHSYLEYNINNEIVTFT